MQVLLGRLFRADRVNSIAMWKYGLLALAIILLLRLLFGGGRRRDDDSDEGETR